jgi:hypothetical protein
MKQVNIYAVGQNAVQFDYLELIPVNAENSYVAITQWRVPVIEGGRHAGYKFVADGAKPSDDSVKVLRIHDRTSNDIFYAAIPDSSSAQAWVNAVNACCDEPVDMPAVTLPVIDIEESVCANADGDLEFFVFTQALVGNQVYVGNASINGTKQPALSAAGYSSLANFVTGAAAWTGFTGGVTNPAGTKVLAKITGPSTATAGLSVEIRNYYESGADAGLTSGNHYTVDATINGVALPQYVGGADVALATVVAALNALPAWARFGVYSVVSNKIRLVAYNNVTSATITLTEVAP